MALQGVVTLTPTVPGSFVPETELANPLPT